MSPVKDPVRQLLEAYRDADTFAAVHYQALRIQQHPECLCQSGKRIAFRRKFRQFAA